MRLVKRIVRVGNTGGVLVPREWVDGTAEVRLVQEPSDVVSDILTILKPVLGDVRGVYLVGSHARGEASEWSDVDVLVVTARRRGRLRRGRYELLLVPEGDLRGDLEKNALPLLAMVREAKPIVNRELIEQYRRVGVSRRNLRWHLEVGKTGLEAVRAILEVDRVTRSLVSDEVAYSIVLRLRSVYVVDCLMRNRRWTTKGLLKLVKAIAGSLGVYDAYLRSKGGKRSRSVVPLEEAEAVLRYVKQRLEEQRRWVEKRG